MIDIVQVIWSTTPELICKASTIQIHNVNYKIRDYDVALNNELDSIDFIILNVL